MNVQINTSSVADIAFLLLIFFLVTTTIQNDKGLMLRLPPKIDSDPIPIHERNIFTVTVNSNDQILIEGKDIVTSDLLKMRVKSFILNNGSDRLSSDSPLKAVVSLKTNRGTTYKKYIEVLDQIQAAYYDIYAEKSGLNAQTFRNLDLSDPTQRKIYESARTHFPMNISIAEPVRDQ